MVLVDNLGDAMETPSSGRTQRAGGVSGASARAYALGIEGRGLPVTAGGCQEQGTGRTGDQGGQAEEVSSYHQSTTAEEAGDGGPGVGFASAAGKPAAAYTRWRESTGCVRAGGPYGRGLAIKDGEHDG